MSASATAADPSTPIAAAARTPLACGDNFGCAISDGRVHCWGHNDFGQLGIGTESNAFHPPAVVPSLSAASLSAGDKHVCALDTAGQVLCWGLGAWGELGDGSKTIADGEILRATVRAPLVVRGLPSRAVAIDAGVRHTCAALDSGQVFCWGANGRGQLGATGPDRSTPAVVPGVEGAVELAGGAAHTCARRADGVVKCWGEGGGPAPVPGLCATQITAGSGFGCAIDCSGALVCWGAVPGRGHDGPRTLGPVPGASRAFAEVRAGYFHVCARTKADKLVCWGSNASGQLGRPNREAIDIIDSDALEVTGAPAGLEQLCASGILARTDARHRPAAATWISTGTTCARHAGGVTCWGEPRPNQAPQTHRIPR